MKNSASFKTINTILITKSRKEKFENYDEEVVCSHKYSLLERKFLI